MPEWKDSLWTNSLLCGRRNPRRSWLERIACQLGTRTNLWNSHTAAGWSWLSDVSRTSAGTGNTSQSRTARQMGQIAAV